MTCVGIAVIHIEISFNCRCKCNWLGDFEKSMKTLHVDETL